MYWFAPDETGRRFVEALRARATEGVDVFVLVDGFGSLAGAAMFDELTAGGISVRWFHPLAPWTKGFQLSQVGMRDHRKILVIDGKTAFVGGINITDRSEPWHDYSARVNGLAAHELRTLFFDTWLRLRGPEPRRLPPVRPRSRKELRRQARAQLGLRPRRGFVHRPSSRLSEEDTARCVVPDPQVHGHPSWTAHHTIRHLYLRRIHDAQHRILIENAYFVPDALVRRALERAARRGVDVHVLVPEVSDLPSVALASRAAYRKLMESGVHIHFWTHGMLHAKTAVIDGWATLGSYNLDYRSLLYNLEVNVATTNDGFVEELAANILADRAASREIGLAAWKERPFWTKCIEWVAYRFRKWL